MAMMTAGTEEREEVGENEIRNNPFEKVDYGNESLPYPIKSMAGNASIGMRLPAIAIKTERQLFIF